jgi:uncharacterized protein
MSDELSIRLNFGRPMPIFPLATVTLLPHAVMPLHIFESRYRQMITDALDGAGQIAMGVFKGDHWRWEYEGKPPIRAAVCVGQIVQHHKLDDGRYYVVLQGICRAKVISEISPPSEHTLYRQVMLEPLGLDLTNEEDLMPGREQLCRLFLESTLSDLTRAKTFVRHLADTSIPISAVLDFIIAELVPDPEAKYELLAEPNTPARLNTVVAHLNKIQTLLAEAKPQRATKRGSRSQPRNPSLN